MLKLTAFPIKIAIRRIIFGMINNIIITTGIKVIQDLGDVKTNEKK
jgi:hypothetical protein